MPSVHCTTLSGLSCWNVVTDQEHGNYSSVMRFLNRHSFEMTKRVYEVSKEGWIPHWVLLSAFPVPMSPFPNFSVDCVPTSGVTQNMELQSDLLTLNKAFYINIIPTCIKLKSIIYVCTWNINFRKIHWIQTWITSLRWRNSILFKVMNEYQFPYSLYSSCKQTIHYLSQISFIHIFVLCNCFHWCLHSCVSLPWTGSRPCDPPGAGW